MTTNSSSQDNGTLESPKTSPTREVREAQYAAALKAIGDLSPYLELASELYHLYGEGQVNNARRELVIFGATTRQAARDELLNELLAELPEKIKFPVIPDMGPGVPESFAQGYGRGEAAGHNEALSAVRTLLSKKKKQGGLETPEEAQNV